MTEQHIYFETFENVAGKEELGILVPAILECITSAFGNEMPEEETDDALIASVMILAKNHDQVVGFATYRKNPVADFKFEGLEEMSEDETYISLESGTVHSEYQELGIYRKLNRLRIGRVVDEKTTVIATTTQNPRVEHGVSVVLNELVQQGKLSSYSVQRERVPGFFKRRLTSEPVLTEGTPFSELDIDKGDCFSILFKLVYAE